ncbi:transposase [Streptomyces sp. NPDC002730]|uniref:transposase n=1 Tax=Streptomyces sp. NPDC002730 TaxID=3364662 RepID=UPI00369FB372
MQAAVEAEMDLHLAEEAGRTGGRGTRSGGNGRNGYRPRKVMTEVGAVTVQVPRDRLGRLGDEMRLSRPRTRPPRSCRRRCRGSPRTLRCTAG